MTMNASILTTAAALSDRDLLSRLQQLAGNERAALVELLAHLAELDTRQSVYAAEGFGSLFAYCTRALSLSEDAAFSRIEVARACRRFPVILDLLADGSVTLTAVRMIARHLTPENHAEVLAAAKRRTKGEVEALIARLAPKPDAKPVIRRLNDPALTPDTQPEVPPTTPDEQPGTSTSGAQPSDTTTDPQPGTPAPTVLSKPARRPVIRASAPARFLVQLTVGQETHDRFRRLQALCARECRGGDPVAVFDLACLMAEKEMLRRKRAATRGSRGEARKGPAARGAAGKPAWAARLGPRQPRSLEARWRALRLRRARRPLHGDQVSRAAPPHPVGAWRADDDRQPVGALPPAQRVRGGAGLRHSCPAAAGG
jgi:hypothetical protein